MTEEEMKKRMKEIDKERNLLKEEKEKYEEYFREKRLREITNSHASFEGKFFKKTSILSDYSNRHKEILAFKIISTNTSCNKSNYAKCLALVDSNNMIGINILDIGLWVENQLRLMPMENSEKVIDYYTEIQKEEFMKLCEDFCHKISLESSTNITQ